MSSLPLQPKKCFVFWDFPMKNVVKVFVIPMSSLGGVHLISGIAQLPCKVSSLFSYKAKKNKWYVSKLVTDWKT